VEWSPGLFQHLDRCLQCQACEAMCPSKVPFGFLMDNARSRLEPHRQRSWGERLLRRTGLRLIASPHWSGALSFFVTAYRRTGLHWLAARLPGIPLALRHLDQLLPDPPAPVRNTTASSDTRPGTTVHLFKGCMGNALDPVTLQATRQVLERLGYHVDTTTHQTCCGALHQHNGEPAAAARLATANVTHFAGDMAPVLATASACSAHLQQYDALYPQAETFSTRVEDIVHFLVGHDFSGLEFRPWPETVAVHIPCSHRNALKQERDIINVLKRIPEIDLLPLDTGAGCCGAAGSYMLSQPELSKQLREQTVDRIAASGARLMVTSNIGCSLHLQAGLKARGLAVQVLHPVALLERCLASAPETA